LPGRDWLPLIESDVRQPSRPRESSSRLSRHDAPCASGYHSGGDSAPGGTTRHHRGGRGLPGIRPPARAAV